MVMEKMFHISGIETEHFVLLFYCQDVKILKKYHFPSIANLERIKIAPFIIAGKVYQPISLGKQQISQLPDGNGYNSTMSQSEKPNCLWNIDLIS